MMSLVVLDALKKSSSFMTRGYVAVWRHAALTHWNPLQSDRSRGFGFITMSTVDEASRCIKELNGVVCIDAYLMMSAI